MGRDEFTQHIQRILFEVWDPLTVNSNKNLIDEYDFYVPLVRKLLDAGRDKGEILNKLWDYSAEMRGGEYAPGDFERTADLLIEIRDGVSGSNDLR